MPAVAQELYSTIGALDSNNNTFLHHAVESALVSRRSGLVNGLGQEMGAFYLDTILSQAHRQFFTDQPLVHIRNLEGKTALDLALEHQESDVIVEMLGKYGAKSIP
jgi:hypothetical protein